MKIFIYIRRYLERVLNVINIFFDFYLFNKCLMSYYGMLSIVLGVQGIGVIRRQFFILLKFIFQSKKMDFYNKGIVYSIK